MSRALASRPTCLVVEDEALIGMLVQDILESAGFEVVGLMASCATALAWLATRTPHLAVIDYMLTDGPSLALARELKQRGVPFAVLSGYEARDARASTAWVGVPWLDKPIAHDLLQRAIHSLSPVPSKRSQPCPMPPDLRFTAPS